MAVSPASVSCEELFPADDFGARWERFADLSPEVVVDRAGVELEDDDRRRDLLTSWLAHELGYSRWWNRREELESEPLWSLLDADRFEQLGEDERRGLLVIARSTEGRLRPSMPPRAALAAVALWRNADRSTLRTEAEQLIRSHPLPDDEWWLYRLVSRFLAVGAARGTDRSPGLFQLAALQLGSEYWSCAARLAGLYFVQRCLPVGLGPDTARLVEACDRAAERRWDREGDWLELMAEAAMRGRLRAPWLEKPVAAVLRRMVASGGRAERLRSYHRRRLYEADRVRLHRLYGHVLGASVEESPTTRKWARSQLLDEIARAVPENPCRALRLAELMVVYEYPVQFGSYRHRIHHALCQIETKSSLEPLDRSLAALYVATCELEPHAVRFVGEVAPRVDWENHPFASRRQLERYEQITDYDRAFADLTFEIDGVTLQLGDREAAVRVRHFREKRVERSNIIRFLRRMLAPVDWLGATLRTTDLYEEALERGIPLLREGLARLDERSRAVDEHAGAGLALSEFRAIAELDADALDHSVEALGRRRLLVGVATGGAVGAVAPFGPRALALADIPVKVALAAEICTRYCWYYGFDPREFDELPVEILEVALETDGRAEFESEGPDATLAELAIQTSLFVEAVATRKIGPFAGRALRGIVEQLTDSGYADALAATVGRAVRLVLDARAPSRRPAPLLGAIVGGFLGGALVYDVSTSARALLSDRFLARKYDDWTPSL